MSDGSLNQTTNARVLLILIFEYFPYLSQCDNVNFILYCKPTLDLMVFLMTGMWLEWLSLVELHWYLRSVNSSDL